MSDGDALLRTILERPDDDTARLVYADWLEEHGRHADELRARFIRDQVWLWANPSCGSCTGPEWSAGKPCAECREREERRGRTAVEMFGRERWLEWSRPANLCVPEGATWDDHIQFARGFVSEIRLTLAAFMRHAESLFRAHPIERVTLTDRLALGDDEIAGGPNRSWNRDRTRIQSMWPNFSYYLPAPIFDRLKDGELVRDPQGIEEFRRYPVYQHPAYPDLSQACVAYGRTLAGLSQVPSRAAMMPV